MHSAKKSELVQFRRHPFTEGENPLSLVNRKRKKKMTRKERSGIRLVSNHFLAKCNIFLVMTFERQWTFINRFLWEERCSPFESKSNWKYIKPLSSPKLTETRKYLYLPYSKWPLIIFSYILKQNSYRKQLFSLISQSLF